VDGLGVTKTFRRKYWLFLWLEINGESMG